jgi:WD40 repeat protein
VRGVALSGDGRLVASGGFDGTIPVWDAEGRLPLATLQGHTSAVLAEALSGDGRLVASGGDDGAVPVWEASSGALRSVLRVERRFEALDITGLTGITDAQRRTMLTLGAIEGRAQTTPSA